MDWHGKSTLEGALGHFLDLRTLRHILMAGASENTREMRSLKKGSTEYPILAVAGQLVAGRLPISLRLRCFSLT